MLNGHGTAHGGIIFTLADTAFAYARDSRNQAMAAQQASIIFLTPGRAGEILTAEAIVTGAASRTIAIFQGLSRGIGKNVLPGTTPSAALARP